MRWLLSLMLVPTLGCTDRGVVGYDCPDAGCMAMSPSEPAAAAPTDAGQDVAVDASCEAGSCNGEQDDDVCVPGRDASCCISDPDCKDDDEVFCHPQQHRCVECLQDAHCRAGSDEPFCVDHECKSCANAAACRAEMECDGQCEDDR